MREITRSKTEIDLPGRIRTGRPSLQSPALPLLLSYSSPTLVPSILGPVAFVNSTSTKFLLLGDHSRASPFGYTPAGSPPSVELWAARREDPPSRPLRVDQSHRPGWTRRSTRKTSDMPPVTPCNPPLGVPRFSTLTAIQAPASVLLRHCTAIIGSRFDSGTGLRYGAVE